MVRQGIAVGNWSEFLCLGGYLAPPRQVGGGCPAGTSPLTPAAGAPPAGPCQELSWQFALPAASACPIRTPVVFDNSQSFLLKRTLADMLVGVLVWQSMAADHNLRSAWSRTTRMAGGGLVEWRVLKS